MSFLVNSFVYAGSLYGDDFVIEMATTGATETVTIPCQDSGTFSATIDWGDGTGDSTITAFNDADLAHEYADAGDHIIRISGTFPNIYFNNVGDKLKLKRILNWGNTGFTVMSQAFYGCTNLTSCTTESVTTTSLSANLWRTFKDCTSMVTCDVSGWDTSSCTKGQMTFQECSSLTALDLSGWDVSGFTDMSNMFSGAIALATCDVSTWVTNSVTNMSTMFQGCDALTDVRIDLFNIEAVTVFTNFMANHNGLTTARYDAVLIAWDAQNPVDSLAVNFGGSTYTSGGAAATARASLESGDLWTITDGGTA